MSFNAWDSVVWPSFMNTMEVGTFRIREFKTVLEWTFTPQWRGKEPSSNWQDFRELHAGRAGGTGIIRFKTREEAEEFINGAVVNQPVLEIHDYQPAQESDWRPLK